MKVLYIHKLSLALLIHFTVLLNLSTSMMTIDAEYSSKKEWDNKYKPIHWEKNLKDMYLESMEDSIRTVSL
jgi:hypothetical protein